MTDAAENAWSHDYPWGRKLPRKRIDELEARKQEIARRRRLFEDRVAERLLDFERQVEAIEVNLEIARKCEQDRLRRIAKQIAYKLLELGVDVMKRVQTEAPTEALCRELLALYEEARKKGGAAVGADREDEEPLGHLADETFVTDDDIRSVTPQEK